eukprot:TRINITY_DN82_c0_g4_i1.p1 TRINITY_DN82_c0_g4~~TRINITY_DN82_c0_g4_i1.p1  ORF type:complete len:729 (+),score=157.03 TRINITY_DN82_c0_g4_i1:1960-4146(+)
MRLTLRTLLAYLDDVLEPAETKLIGEKIQESAVAGKLVSLIKLVVRQRRLKAPSVSGPNVGIDPNIVSQYLDSTLPPEQVVDVEKVLLTSDELLAEVASCHQVLALVMGKPMEISEASRERLYALGPVDQTDRLQVEAPRSLGSSESVAASMNGRDSATHNAPKAPPEIPEYLRQNSWSQRVVPAAIVALLVLICLGLLVSDTGFLTGIREAKRELTKSDRDSGQKVAVAEPRPNGDENAEGKDSSPKEPKATSPTSDLPPSPSTPMVSKPAVDKPATDLTGIDLPPPADAPPPAAPKPMPPADVPADAASVAGTRPKPPAVVEAPANAAGGKEPTPVLNALPVQYISNDGVVLRFDDAQQHWFLLPRRSAIAPNEALIVLEPFEAVLDIDRGGLTATVLGDTAVRLLPPDRATAVGLDVRRGRVMLKSSRKDASQSPVISIAVGSDTWQLELLSADTVCTIEVAPREPVNYEKALGPNWYIGVLRVLSGSVKWTGEDGQAQQVAAESALEIIPQVADGVRPLPVSSSFVPDWTDAQKRKQSPLRRFSALFEKQFELDQPVEMTLLALIKDSNAKIVELTVHGLALTDSYQAMAQALAECSYEEGRFAARDGLRTWLAREADRGPALKAILEQHYPAAEAGGVYGMLWGFRPEDATNRAVSLELANWLRSNHVEIRELAYYWVVHLSGRKWEFRATDIPARRESAVRKIEAHIATVGALVKPTEKESK